MAIIKGLRQTRLDEMNKISDMGGEGNLSIITEEWTGDFADNDTLESDVAIVKGGSAVLQVLATRSVSSIVGIEQRMRNEDGSWPMDWTEILAEDGSAATSERVVPRNHAQMLTTHARDVQYRLKLGSNPAQGTFRLVLIYINI